MQLKGSAKAAEFFGGFDEVLFGYRTMAIGLVANVGHLRLFFYGSLTPEHSKYLKSRLIVGCVSQIFSYEVSFRNGNEDIWQVLLAVL